MMHNIVLYCKTYAHDMPRVFDLVKSIDAYNEEHIALYLSVNDEDWSWFQQDNILPTVPKDHILRDSDIYKISGKYRWDGWRYQQIIKANFHKLNIAKNYVCLDSDSTFITPFTANDFLYTADIPYTVMHESKDMKEYMDRNQDVSDDAFFMKAARGLRSMFHTPALTKTWDWGPSPFIWNCEVWKHMEDNLFRRNNFDFEDWMYQFEQQFHTQPSEYMLYGEYLFSTKLFPIVPIQPLFKVYHWKHQWEADLENGNIPHLYKNYLGIIKQSNWTNAPK